MMRDGRFNCNDALHATRCYDQIGKILPGRKGNRASTREAGLSKGLRERDGNRASTREPP
eukprot:577817-Pyramimonas_sp.AAC.1